MIVVHSWLQEFLSKKLTVGQAAEAMSTAGIEVEKVITGAQAAIDITTPANRPDLNSVLGVAREVAAQSNCQVKNEPKDDLKTVAPRSFKVAATKVVGRYALAELKLKRPIKASPAWLQKRLKLCGIRPINVVVDITNYCMLAYGQSFHAFDKDKIAGKFVIRLAARGEQLQTLDGQKRQLSAEDLIIADDSGVIDLAGIMGGQSTEITAGSRNIWLTAPNFDGATVRKSALRLGLRTESSARFERGLPLAWVGSGLSAAIKLLDQLLGVEVIRVEDQQLSHPRQTTISIRPERLSRLMSVVIKPATIKSHLQRLGFSVTGSGAKLKVAVPSWRPDIKLEEDVYEEVIKLVGLDKIPASLPAWQPSEVTADNYWGNIWRLRDFLAGLGNNEVTTYPFVSAQQIDNFGLDGWRHLRLQNPMSEEQTHLRTTLAPNLVQAVANNSRLTRQFGLFEIARVFAPSKQTMPMEIERYGLAIQYPTAAYQGVKNVLDQIASWLNLEPVLVKTNFLPFLHPDRQAEVRIGKDIIAFIGELNPALAARLKIRGQIGYLEGWVDGLFSFSQPPRYQAIPRWPTVHRDISLAAEQDVTWQDIKRIVGSTTLAEAEYLGDFYTPQGQRIVTIRLIITPTTRTLKDQEIAKQVGKVVAQLEKNLPLKLRH